MVHALVLNLEIESAALMVALLGVLLVVMSAALSV
jgi:hypothetical protein